MTTGERIKARRKQLGMSAEDLAEKIGMAPATVYRYENGEISKVASDKLQPIADALFTTPAALMGFDDTANPDDEIWNLRESMRRNPDLRILFDAARNATAEELQEAANLIKARKTIREIGERK